MQNQPLTSAAPRSDKDLHSLGITHLDGIEKFPLSAEGKTPTSPVGPLPSGVETSTHGGRRAPAICRLRWGVFGQGVRSSMTS